MTRDAEQDTATERATVDTIIDHLFRRRAGQITAVLTRIFGFDHLDLVEDVVQEALIAALTHWPHSGIPEKPGAWIVRVARNRALDQLRRRTAWRGKEDAVRRSMDRLARLEDVESGFAAEIHDDQLSMIFACCHPLLPRETQVALTLKTVTALSVDEIARAFLARPATVAQRLVRAKRRLRRENVSLQIPQPNALPERLDIVLEVIYLLFNEGYSATAGEDLVRIDLCGEAMRLVSMLTSTPVTATPQSHALEALLVFQSARFATRVGPDGVPLRLSEQDRRRWDASRIAHGFRSLARAGQGDTLTRYHLEAEIAAYHASARRNEDTDWRRILACYDILMQRHPSPVVALNRAVVVAETEGTLVALEAIEALIDDGALADYPLLWSTRGALRARAGLTTGAADDFARARALSASAPAKRFLARRFAEVANKRGDDC